MALGLQRLFTAPVGSWLGLLGVGIVLGGSVDGAGRLLLVGCHASVGSLRLRVCAD